MSKFESLSDALDYVRVLQKPVTLPGLHDSPKPRRSPILSKKRGRELVAGGDPVRYPVDRTAAKVIAKAPWWGKPPEETSNEETTMSDAANGMVNSMNRGRDARGGLTIHRVGGQEMISLDEAQAMIMEQISKLPKDTRPLVAAARDSRSIVNELLHGIGGEMEQFRADMKTHMEYLRRNRSAVMTEVGTLLNALRDVRQFFMDADYHVELERLRDFVEVCERLKALKESGFLDDVAETMLKLSKADEAQ